MKIAASILSADFGKLNQEIKEIENYVDWIHVDVMDGNFVPNISIGAPVVKCIKSNKPLDRHLMISEPEKYIGDFIKAGASFISTHIELGLNSVKNCLKQCIESGVKYGVVINPSTKVEEIFPILNEVDFVLIMSVNPGFGGQKFIEEVLKKVKILKKKNPNLLIEIDGGINGETIKKAKESGVDISVAGSYIFGSKNRIKAINSLK